MRSALLSARGASVRGAAVEFRAVEGGLGLGHVEDRPMMNPERFPFSAPASPSAAGAPSSAFSPRAVGIQIIKPCSPFRTLRPLSCHCQNPPTMLAVGSWVRTRHEL